jgi:hypothetical protein
LTPLGRPSADGTLVRAEAVQIGRALHDLAVGGNAVLDDADPAARDGSALREPAGAIGLRGLAHEGGGLDGVAVARLREKARGASAGGSLCTAAPGD